MKDNLGTVLQKLRKEANLTAKDVVEKLQVMGYSISDKTLSGYETGIRMPNADIFMALCQVYNCKNILEIFSFVKADYSIPTDEECGIIDKYRLIDDYGQETVRMILNRESARVEEIERLKKNASIIIDVTEGAKISERAIQYFRSVSAGTGEVIFDDAYSERISIPDIEKYRRVAYAVKVIGHSMEPRYKDGDILLVEPTCTIELNEIGIFNVDGKAFVKKLGQKELISLNKGYENISFTEYSRCMGRVIDRIGAEEKNGDI